MPIKITCNGNLYETKIVDMQTGNNITNCTRVEIVLDAEKGRPEAVLHLTDVELDVVADVVNSKPPSRHIDAAYKKRGKKDMA